MATLRNDTVIRSADGQGTSAIVTASNIGSYGVATNSTYYVGTTQNIFNRASGAQTLTGVSIDGNAATVTNGLTTGNYNSYALPLAGGTMTGNLTITKASAYLHLNGTNSDSELRFLANSSDRWAMGMNVGDATENLNIYNYTTTTVNFTILKASGNVGIGITNPAQKLHVVGVGYSDTDFRAPIFYDSANTAYYCDPNGISSLFGVAIRGDQASSNTNNQIFFWDAGNTTTSAIGFKANAGVFTNPTGNGDGYNTYLTMDADGRGWVFRRGVGGTDFTSAYTAGWILNNGIWQANASMRAPIFYDSNDTAYYLDPANTGTSLLVAGKVGIGTTSPGYKLDVNGTFRTATNNLTIFNDYLYVSPTENNTFNSAYSTNGIADMWINYAGYNNGNTQFRNFNVGNGKNGIIAWFDGTNKRMSINNNQAASYPLHVVGTAYSDTDFRAPIFYDSNNTAYYCDPASTSVINRIDLPSGSAAINTTTPGTSAYQLNFTGQSTADYAQAITWGWSTLGAQAGIYVQSSGGYGTKMYIATTDSFATGSKTAITIDHTGVVTTNRNYLQATGSLRAPIFYDSDNTAYYIDAASTSNLVGLTVANTITGSVSGNAGTATVLQTARNINGTSFNGSAAITTASWGTARTLTIGSTGKSVDGSAAVSWSLAELGAAATNQTMFIGTTSVAINRASASQTLTGVSIDGNAATATNGLTTSNYVSYSAFTGSVTSTYGNFTTPGLIIGDAQYGFYVVSGNVYYKSASGGVHYWRNTANSGNTMSLDNSGNLNVSGYLQTTGNLIYPSTYGVTQRLEVSNAANNAWIDGLTIAPGGIVTAYGDSRAPIFYDSNDTAYYTDPNGTSVLNRLKIDGGNFAFDYFQSLSDFVSGTLVTTDIPASAANGLSFVMNVIGKSYNTATSPFDFNVQGYLYNSTIINYSGMSLDSTGLSTIKVFENGGFLCFWWARVSYWNAFEVSVRSYDAAKTNYNRVTNITDVVEPTGTKKVTVTLHRFMRADASATNSVDLRAPIFYDSNDTAYYVDPASTSILNGTRHNTVVAGSTSAMTSAGQLAIYSSANPYISFHDGGVGRTAYMQETGGRFYFGEVTYTESEGSFRAPLFYDTNNTAYYVDPASTSNLNALTVAGGNATIYRDLIVNGGGSGNFGNRIIVQGTATTYTYQDTTLRPTVYLNGDYPVVTLNATATTNTLHGPTLQFAFNGLTTGGATSRQIVIGTPGTGSWLDFGFSGGANGDNSSYNPHNGIGGYNGVTAMRLFSNGLLVGSTGAYPNAVTSTSFALDVRGTGSSNTDFRAPIFYDSANTGYYLDPAGNSQVVSIYANDWFRAQGNTGLYFQDKGYGITSAGGASNSYGNASTYGTGLNGWQGWGIGSRHCMMSTGADNFGVHDNTRGGWLYYWNGTYHNFQYGYLESASSVRAPLFYDSNNTAYYIDAASTSNLSGLNIVDGNLELYKSQTVDMSNVATYSISNYYPVTISVPTEGCIIQIQNNLNSNVPSWSTHGGGFTLNLRWRTNGSGWGTTAVRRYIEQYHERFASTTICGGITQMNNSSIEVVWLRGGGQYYFKFSRNLAATAQATAYTLNSQTVTPTPTAQNTIWNSYEGGWTLYNDTTYSTSNMYTPVLYDYNNSAYYVDPASTSNLVGLTVANTITGSVSGTAGSISGFNNPTTAATANTIVYRDANGHIFGNYILGAYFNSSAGNSENPTIGQIWTQSGSDNYLRKSTPAHFRSQVTDGSYPSLTGANASGTWSINVTGNAGGSSTSCTGNAASVTDGMYLSGTQTITGVKYFQSNLGTTLGSLSGPPLQAYATGTNAAFMSFHRSGSYAVNFGLDSDNVLRIGGWSASANRLQLDMGGNLTVATNMYANGFYDNNNTALYCDPNGTSLFTGLTVTNTITGSITGNAGGSSASCTGNSATTTLATKATRANGNFYIDDNYGNTVVGAYSASRYQGVYAMGDSYKLAADGSTTGSLYGIAWSHPNAGGAAGNLSNHGALILLNGGYAAAISSSIRCTVDMRTPIYYDSDNTSYYIDAGSTSYLYVLSVASAATAADYYTAGWFRSSTSGNGMYNQVTTQHFYSDSINYWNVASSAATQGIRFRTGGHNGTVRGYIIADTNNDVGLLNQDGNWRVRVVSGDYTIFDGSSIRAQIFYDSNDTAYYLDPRSTSVLSGLKLNGIDNEAAGTGSDAILWINKPNNNDWAIRVSGNLEYLLKLEGATSHTYNIQGLANGSEFWRCGTDLLYHNSSIRAPIFYDSDNTTYYLDAANSTTSLLVAGKVGIGTTSPATKLHVTGSAGAARNVQLASSVGLGSVFQQNNTVAALSRPAITLRNTVAGDASSIDRGVGIQFDLGYGGDNFDNVGTRVSSGYITLAQESNADWTVTANRHSYITIATISAGTVAEKVRISSTGNVGIGTSSPAVKLDILANNMSFGPATTDARRRQTITGEIVMVGSGPTKIFTCGSFGTGIINIIAFVTDTTNCATATFSFCHNNPSSGGAGIGSVNRLTFAPSTNGVISQIYLDMGYTNPSTEYKLQIVYSGATAPTVIFSAEGHGSQIWAL